MLLRVLSRRAWPQARGGLSATRCGSRGLHSSWGSSAAEQEEALSPDLEALEGTPANMHGPLRLFHEAEREARVKSLQQVLGDCPLHSFTLPVMRLQAAGDDDVEVLEEDEQQAVGSVVGEVELPEHIFGEPVRKDLVLQVVHWQRMKKRMPYKGITQQEARGSTRKLRQQKGLGRARMGHRFAPHLRGGVKRHAPVLRKFEYTLNRKQKAAALVSALSAKFREGNLVLVDEFTAKTHRTGPMAANLQALGLSRKATYLCIDDDDEPDANFILATRNIKNVRHLPVRGANVYDIVRHELLLMTPKSVQQMEERIRRQLTSLSKVSRPCPDQPRMSVLAPQQQQQQQHVGEGA